MKKVITILAISVIVASAIFAATGDTLNITASAAQIVPGFILQGKLTGTSKAGTAETANSFVSAPTTLESVLDPTVDTITADIQVLQNTKSRYNKPVTITVYATPFMTANYTSTIMPEASNPSSKITENGKFEATSAVGKSESNTTSTNNAIIITVDYKSGYLDATSTNKLVGSGTFTWAPDIDLPVEATGDNTSTTYTATIVLKYSAS